MKKKDLCIRCGWNTGMGCSCPTGEEIWQCNLYKQNHPEEVEQFEKDMEEWSKKNEKPL